jgi:hypothetical protein
MANFARKLRTIAKAATLAVALLAAPARAAVTVAITPANGTVTPGTDFDLFVDVTSAGSQFNGFEMVVEFDPAVLTFVPLAPTTLQQGCLMTGSCSGSCGNTFISSLRRVTASRSTTSCSATWSRSPGRAGYTSSASTPRTRRRRRR